MLESAVGVMGVAVASGMIGGGAGVAAGLAVLGGGRGGSSEEFVLK